MTAAITLAKLNLIACMKGRLSSILCTIHRRIRLLDTARGVVSLVPRPSSPLSSRLKKIRVRVQMEKRDPGGPGDEARVS